MKGRIFALSLALLLLLSGCAGWGQDAGQEETAPPPQVETEEQGEEPVREEPVREEQEEPVEPEYLDYDAIRFSSGKGGDFYRLSALETLQDVSIADAVLLDRETALLLCGLPAVSLQKLDLETGALEELCRLPLGSGELEFRLEGQEMPNWGDYGQILSVDPLVVAHSGQENTYARVDPETGEYALLDDLSGMEYFYYTDTGMGRRGAYFYHDGSGTLFLMPWGTEQLEPVGQIPAEYIYVSLYGLNREESQAIFQATVAAGETEVTLVMDLDTGEVGQVYAGGQGRLLRGAPYLEVEWAGEDGEDSRDLWNVLAWKPGAQVQTQVDLSPLLPPEAIREETALWLSCKSREHLWGKTLLMCYVNDTAELLLWDYSQVQPEVVAEELEPYQTTETDLGALTQRAREMEETYGIRIYLGQEVADSPFPDYTLEPCQENDLLEAGLDTLEEAFSYYPEGYLDQLGGDSVRELCFYLAGAIHPVDPSVSVTDPSGLSCQVEYLELIGFNVSYMTAADVVHELSHTLDHWLLEEGVLDEETWSSLNPEGFEYYYGYISEDGTGYDLSGDTKYTSWDAAYYDGDVESVYFVDPYATTLPTEDRARLLEYAYLSGEYPSGYGFFYGSHIQAKLDYYFQCIRQMFDTSAWPELTGWEEAMTYYGWSRTDSETGETGGERAA